MERDLFALIRRLVDLCEKRASIHRLMDVSRLLPFELGQPIRRRCMTQLSDLQAEHENDVKKYDEKYGTHLAGGTIIDRAAPDGPHWKLRGRDEKDELQALFEKGLKSQEPVSEKAPKEGHAPESRRPESRV
jgi:hypothetical protein